MNILFISDIFGRPGRETVKKALQELRKTRQIDVVIANGENMAHGKGISLKTFRELEKDVDLFTTGNHTWADDAILTEVNRKDARILRPANLPPGNDGIGYRLLKKGQHRVLVINLIGRVFAKHNYDCPFRAMDEILKEFSGKKPDAIVVDFHAEATSEKVAMKHFLDGRVTALIGTHTHIPTADAHVTENGMAYMTDAGMVGPADSVIGIDKNEILESFIKQTPFRIEVPFGPCVFDAVMIEVDEGVHGRKARSIEPIHFFFE